MTGVPIIATATSIGTGTTKTKINGGNDLKLPSPIGAIQSVIPYQIPLTALTAAESAVTNFYLESQDYTFDPCQFPHQGAMGGLGATFEAMHPIFQPYIINANVAKKSPNLSIYGQALVANTAAMLAGLELDCTFGGAGGKQRYYKNPNAMTATGTTVNTRTVGSTITISGASKICELISATIMTTVLASDSLGGYMEFTSPDYENVSVIPNMATMPIITGLGAAVGVMIPAMSRRSVVIPLKRTGDVTITPYFTNEQAINTAGKFMAAIGYEK